MKCKVMGIVNVTPDSFSDGGMFYKPEEAIRRANNLILEGAEIIDLGGESTRPDATPIDWQTEFSRIEPVLLSLRKKDIKISIDTYHPETAKLALERGADIINCVSYETKDAMIDLIEKFSDKEAVIPFRIGDKLPKDVSRLYLDPMIGFNTTREEDLQLLKSVPSLAKFGRVLIGASRKRIVKKLTGEKVVGKNLGGNLGIALWCAMHGADVVRVHDVRETVQALRVVDALS